MSSAWAKFTRCITPKISEMPSANNAYVLPTPETVDEVLQQRRHVADPDERVEQVGASASSAPRPSATTRPVRST